MTQPDISVVIVTRNRRHLIFDCLQALAKQTVKLSELLIIDNNSTDSTVAAIRQWAKQLQKAQRSTFPVRVIIEKKIGYPYVYNRGLREAKYNWVAFIDDDCVADLDWCQRAQCAIRQKPAPQVILGFSHTQKPDNIYSLATFLFNFDWKEKWTSGTHIHNYEVLDNKNILYFRPFLLKHQIRFAEDKMQVVGGAAEDCRLGWQLQQAGAVAYYDRGLRVRHKDPDGWQWYWKKYFVSLAAYVAFTGERATSLTPHKVPFRQHVLRLAAEHGHSPFWQLRFIALVYVNVAISYLLRVLFTFPAVKQWYIQLFS